MQWWSRAWPTRRPAPGGSWSGWATSWSTSTTAGPAAKEVFAEMVERGGDPARIIAERGLDQVTDEAALTAIVDRVMAENPDSVVRYRAGKTALIGFFV